MDNPKKRFKSQERNKYLHIIHILAIIVKMPRMVTIHCHIFDRCAPGRIPQQIGSGASLRYLLQFPCTGLTPDLKGWPRTIHDHYSLYTLSMPIQKIHNTNCEKPSNLYSIIFIKKNILIKSVRKEKMNFDFILKFQKTKSDQNIF